MSPEAGFAALLQAELQSAGLEFTKLTRKRLALYCSELSRWNERFNLTGLGGAALVRRLVIEPVWIGRELQISGIVADIGSGNGSPAVPLAITRELDSIQLVEVRTRRVVFLRHLAATLKLKNAQVYPGRFEEVAGEIGPVDWVTLQAVTPTKEIVEAIRRISKISTKIAWITSTETNDAAFEIAASLIVPFSNTIVRILNIF